MMSDADLLKRHMTLNRLIDEPDVHFDFINDIWNKVTPYLSTNEGIIYCLTDNPSEYVFCHELMCDTIWCSFENFWALVLTKFTSDYEITQVIICISLSELLQSPNLNCYIIENDDMIKVEKAIKYFLNPII